MSSFSLFLSGPPSEFTLQLELASTSLFSQSSQDTLELFWKDTDPWTILKDQLKDRIDSFLTSKEYEICHLQLEISDSSSVRVSVEIQTVRPQIVRVVFKRIAGNGDCDIRYLYETLSLLPVDSVRYFLSQEGFPFCIPALTSSTKWKSLKHLSLVGCGLIALPSSLGEYTLLKELRLSRNKLTALPREIGKLTALEVLEADYNEIVVIPGDLCHCVQLRVLNLEHNQLSALVLDLQQFPHLQSLLLMGNPLSYIPELSICHELHILSLKNLKVLSDPDYTHFQVIIDGQSSLSCGKRLSPLFSVLFSRSSSQHPLLAGALGRLAEYKVNCEAIVELPGAPLQQLVLMALSPNHVVQEQAAKIIGLLVHNANTAEVLMKSGVLDALLTLLDNPLQNTQIYALKALASLALSSDHISHSLLTPPLIGKLLERVDSLEGKKEVQHIALETLGNFSFALENKKLFLEREGLKHKLKVLASSPDQPESSRKTRLLALRVLAILGEYEEIERLLGESPIGKRGIKILSIDGGGMKGISGLKMLREIEEKTGERIFNSFDLIAGTSSGAMLAVALGILNFTLEQCDEIYKKLGYRVFNQAQEEEQAGWKDSLVRMYRSGQQGLRVVMAGCKHDASTFETLLKEFSNQLSEKSIGNLYIDSAVLGGPKVFAVSTLTSITPAVPFLFRNYELPGSMEAKKSSLGSSKYEIWQGIRASSAAPYYFDDFKLDGLHFQDGATTANNPSALAIEQARLLWPNNPIECLVSIGLGAVPASQREKSSSSFIENGNVLIESSCSVERIDEILTTMTEMIPGLNYFRFNPVDKRCDLALDGLDAEKWNQLEEATQDYIHKQNGLFQKVADLLMKPARQDSQLLCQLQTIHPFSLLFIRSGLEQNSISQSLHLMEYSRGMLDCRQQEIFLSGQTEALQIDSRRTRQQFLLEALKKVNHQLSGVHIDLPTTIDHSAFVLSWRTSLWSVQTNSPEAQKLCLELKCEESLLVSELQSRGRFAFEQGFCELVSKQEIYSEGNVSSLLVLKKSEPGEILEEQDIMELKDLIGGLMVFTSQHLSASIVKVFMYSGAQSVVCAEEPLPLSFCEQSKDFHKLCCFFKTLYESVSKGIDIKSSLKTSERQFSTLQGMFLITTHEL